MATSLSGASGAAPPAKHQDDGGTALLLVGGAALLAGGAWFFFFRHPAATPIPTPIPTPTPTPSTIIPVMLRQRYQTHCQGSLGWDAGASGSAGMLPLYQPSGGSWAQTGLIPYGSSFHVDDSTYQCLAWPAGTPGCEGGWRIQDGTYAGYWVSLNDVLVPAGQGCAG